MTGELPYDRVVVAALTSFKVHVPDTVIAVASGGNVDPALFDRVMAG